MNVPVCFCTATQYRAFFKLLKKKERLLRVNERKILLKMLFIVFKVEITAVFHQIYTVFSNLEDTWPVCRTLDVEEHIKHFFWSQFGLSTFKTNLKILWRHGWMLVSKCIDLLLHSKLPVIFQNSLKRVLWLIINEDKIDTEMFVIMVIVEIVEKFHQIPIKNSWSFNLLLNFALLLKFAFNFQ